MLATGADVTVRVALPVLPSLVAMIFAVPTETAMTAPPAETVAMAVLLELHVIVRPLSVPPFASSVIAEACVVSTALIEVAVSDTVIDAIGTGTTVIEELPVLPSLTALIVAAPTARAVTSPFASIDAIALSLEDHTTARPVRVAPVPSFVVAESCWVDPTLRVALGGSTAIDATGTGVTVSVAEPVLVSLVAMIFAEPTATAVTRPVDDTVATPGFSDAQLTTLPVRLLPLPSRVVAVACVDWPNTMDDEPSVTFTDATGIASTLSEAFPVFPSLAAVMDAVPGETAVTRPVALTVATAELLELHVTARPVMT